MSLLTQLGVQTYSLLLTLDMNGTAFQRIYIDQYMPYYLRVQYQLDNEKRTILVQLDSGAPHHQTLKLCQDEKELAEYCATRHIDMSTGWTLNAE